jgi:hypothetical protein
MGEQKRKLDVLEEEGRIQLLIPQDRMRAELIVRKPLSEEEISNFESVGEFLSRKGIVSGLKEEVLQDSSDILKKPGSYLLAQGRLPVRGKDGWVKLFFEEEVTKEIISEEDRINLFGVTRVPEVRPGDLLAEIMPPEEGEPGEDIFGNPVPPLRGREARIAAGKNARFSEDGKQVFATIAGRPQLLGNRITVHPVFEVRGDVDAQTGSVSFVGSVVVRGDVRSGFSVDAEGDIEVWGVVEAASLRAGGHIHIRKSFVGSGAGVAQAAGSVRVRMLESATIIAGGDVFIEEAALHSNVSCGGNLIVDGKKGLLVGGQVRAGGWLWAKVIGSPMGTKTFIEVGASPELREEYRKTREELERIQCELSQTEKALTLLLRKKAQRKVLDDRFTEMFTKLQVTHGLLSKKREFLQKRLNEIEDELSRRESKVLVEEKVYPQVRITIGNFTYVVREEIPYASFEVKGGEIVLGSFERPKVRLNG